MPYLKHELKEVFWKWVAFEESVDHMHHGLEGLEENIWFRSFWILIGSNSDSYSDLSDDSSPEKEFPYSDTS